VFEDPGVSGGKPLASRPEGNRLLAEARRTHPVVVVARLDRLFRSVADAAQTIAEFDRLGIELVVIAEGFDMTNPYGRAMAQMDDSCWPREGAAETLLKWPMRRRRKRIPLARAGRGKSKRGRRWPGPASSWPTRTRIAWGAGPRESVSAP
jgi:hypothetical protein